MLNLLTPKEVAEILKISYEGALSFIKTSGVTYHRIGHQYRVAQEDLEAFMNRKGGVHVDLIGE